MALDLIVLSAVGAIIVFGVFLGRLRDLPPSQRWLDGLGAAIVISIILPGIDAGLSRTCMPKLDWS